MGFTLDSADSWIDCAFRLQWGTTVLSDEEVNQLALVLTPSEKDRAQALSGPNSDRYLAGRFLARQLGSTMLECDWTSVVPQAQCDSCGMDHGAISVKGSDLHISLSSTGNRIVAAGIRGKSIGVDIERGQLLNVFDVATKTATQPATLAQWCDYEAVAKASGLGIAISVDEITYTSTSGGVMAIVPGVENGFTLFPAVQYEDVVLSVATGR